MPRGMRKDWPTFDEALPTVPCKCPHPFQLAPGAECFLCGHGNVPDTRTLTEALAGLCFD